jgi:hypothetical protein
MLKRMELREVLLYKVEFEKCKGPEEKKKVFEEMMSTIPTFINQVFLRGTYFELFETSHYFYEDVIYGKERMRDFSRPGYSDSSR